MARPAIIRRPRKLPVDMAEFTGCADMRPGKCIPRLIMVERRRSPPFGSMTRLAFRRELRRDMVGIRG